MTTLAEQLERLEKEVVDIRRDLCTYTFDDADSLSIHVEQIAKVVGSIIAALRAGEEQGNG